MDSKNKINQIIRVDLAGEKGAIEIYKGQLALIKDENFSKEIKLMLEKEREHLETFSEILVKYKVRPTILDPLWKIGALVWNSISSIGKKSNYGLH